MTEPVMSDDRLLVDIEHHARQIDPPTFNLWWLGQSGYLLQHNSDRLLIDPYLSDSLTEKYAATATPHVRISRRVIDPARLPRVDGITSSHNHTDHLDAATILPVLGRSPAASIIVPEANRAFAADRLKLPPDRLKGVDAGQHVRVGPFEINAVPAAHPSVDRDEHGRCKCLGYVIRVAGWSIYHSGDTMNVPEIAAAARVFGVHVALLPINGKLGNMDASAAAELARSVGARISIPCHFGLFEFNTAPPKSFVAAAEKIGLRTRVLQLGERFSSKDVPQ